MLDSLGLYQIADWLAVQLVPAVRERMQRIRFFTAMAVGALVTEGRQIAQELNGGSSSGRSARLALHRDGHDLDRLRSSARRVEREYLDDEDDDD